MRIPSWMRNREYFTLAVAGLVPRKIRYWCFIVSTAEATTGQWSDTLVPAVTAMTVLERIK